MLNKLIAIMISTSIGWGSYWFIPTERGEVQEGKYEYHTKAWVDNLDREVQGMWIDESGNPVEVHVK